MLSLSFAWAIGFRDLSRWVPAPACKVHLHVPCLHRLEEGTCAAPFSGQSSALGVEGLLGDSA